MNYEFLESTLAIVVLYNEKIDDSKTLISLDKGLYGDDLLDLIVYDNSKTIQEVKNSKFKRFRITYLHNPNNPGVSFAYNYGAEQAKKLNKNWLLLLDQDTCFERNIFESYNASIEKNSDISLFAPILKINEKQILSPCKFNFYGQHLKSINFGRQLFDDNSPVNSGILIQVDSFFAAGGYNNNVQLDLSDHQFIERFKNKHKSYVVVNSIGLQNFSAIEDDIEKQLVRFEYYCQGVFNFETNIRFKKPIMILFLVLRTFKKTIKYITLRFLMILYIESKAGFKP